LLGSEEGEGSSGYSETGKTEIESAVEGAGAGLGATAAVTTAGLVVRGRARTPAANDIGEGIRADVNVLGAHECTIADIAVSAVKFSAARVFVRADDHVAIPGEADGLVPVFLDVVRGLAIGAGTHSNNMRFGFAVVRVLTKIRGISG